MLSGGGPIGIGWHSGMIAGFADAGIDLTQADLFVGTSAGAVVGSQVARGRKPLDEINRIVETKPDSRYANAIGDNMQRLMELMTTTADLDMTERLKEYGRFSVEAETAPEENFLTRFAHLGTDGWPPRFVCTAIDTADGTFTAWTESDGVDPAAAIASSCSVPGFFPPVTINGRRYMDGGMRSLANADLAAGHDRVLVLTLFAAPPDATDPRAVRVRAQMEAEGKAIADAGGESLVLAPDAETQAVLGVNLMDPSRTSDAAEAGRAQATRIADTVATFWDPA